MPLAGEWFRTGDAGFLDDNGFLSVTGRIKELISMGGAKFAPEEVWPLTDHLLPKARLCISSSWCHCAFLEYSS